VHAVAALAPWVPPGEPVAQAGNRRLSIPGGPAIPSLNAARPLAVNACRADDCGRVVAGG